jgi:hypothetical protein
MGESTRLYSGITVSKTKMKGTIVQLARLNVIPSTPGIIYLLRRQTKKEQRVAVLAK